MKLYKDDLNNIKPKNFSKKVAIYILTDKAKLYLDRMKNFMGPMSIYI